MLAYTIVRVIERCGKFVKILLIYEIFLSKKGFRMKKRFNFAHIFILELCPDVNTPYY